jgi:opacity protein-like surface antigen
MAAESRRLSAVVTMLACFALAPVRASAQSPLAGEWFLSPAVGVAFDPDADVSLTISGAVGYPLTSAVALEGELGHVFDMASGDRDVDSSLTTVHGSVLYFFDSDYVATPYLAAGLGVGRFSHRVRLPPASIEATELGFDLGGGVTYPLQNNTWLRGDFRYFKHIDDIPSAWRFSGSVVLRVAN